MSDDPTLGSPGERGKPGQGRTGGAGGVGGAGGSGEVTGGTGGVGGVGGSIPEAERLTRRSRWLLPIAAVLVLLSVLTIVVSIVAIRAHQNAEQASSDQLCAAVDDIHKSLVAFVREHHAITEDLREVGVFHEQVPLRKTLEPLDVECAKRTPGGHQHAQLPVKQPDRSGQKTPRNGSKGVRNAPTASQGGGQSSAAPPSSQPGPPSGGPPGNPNPPGNPPPSGGLLDPAVDTACDLTGPVISLPAICR